MVLRSVGVMSVAKLMGVLYAAIGFLIGAFMAMFSMLGAGMMAADQGAGAGALSMMFGVGSIIFLPIFYGLIGAVGGAIGAALYNLVAGFIGGVELNLE
ncbi:MAG TPA: hypothetical protein VGD06_16475 [Acidobacteriota bacterium]|jgi:hypothetical protein